LAVLDILYKFAPGMESGRKNKGFILNLLIQFKVIKKVEMAVAVCKAGFCMLVGINHIKIYYL
jgi:hypothetical protein